MAARRLAPAASSGSVAHALPLSPQQEREIEMFQEGRLSLQRKRRSSNGRHEGDSDSDSLHPHGGDNQALPLPVSMPLREVEVRPASWRRPFISIASNK
mgnify:CR=1 FL=1